ncbi:hypothetical protein GH714_018815 [Hevea brasiliensis]|uniref:Uncharacterized protein n=1 Tax=Hevea brasiliensis TaxID=3981 RepID=A0A6A6KWA2_HEVBR|nr:hypothetical protein GH714_018815 [Hevea brasiliensis]
MTPVEQMTQLLRQVTRAMPPPPQPVYRTPVERVRNDEQFKRDRQRKRGSGPGQSSAVATKSKRPKWSEGQSQSREQRQRFQFTPRRGGQTGVSIRNSAGPITRRSTPMPVCTHFFDMTCEESIQGTVDADIGGAGGDTDIGDAGGSKGGAGGILILVVQEEVKALSLKMLVVLGFLGAAEGVLWGILMLILVVQEEVKALSLKILAVLEFLGAAERVLSGILMLVEALAGALAGVQD